MTTMDNESHQLARLTLQAVANDGSFEYEEDFLSCGQTSVCIDTSANGDACVHVAARFYLDVYPIKESEFLDPDPKCIGHSERLVKDVNMCRDCIRPTRFFCTMCEEWYCTQHNTVPCSRYNPKTKMTFSDPRFVGELPPLAVECCSPHRGVICREDYISDGTTRISVGKKLSHNWVACAYKRCADGPKCSTEATAVKSWNFRIENERRVAHGLEPLSPLSQCCGFDPEPILEGPPKSATVQAKPLYSVVCGNKDCEVATKWMLSSESAIFEWAKLFKKMTPDLPVLKGYPR